MYRISLNVIRYEETERENYCCFPFSFFQLNGNNLIQLDEIQVKNYLN